MRDTAGAASQVESAAVALQAKLLDDRQRDVIGSALGVTIEEAPAAPSVIDVQVQVMRLAPSPPPPSPQLPSAGDLVATQEEDGSGLAIGLALVGGCIFAGMLMGVYYRQRVQSCMDSMAKSATTNTPAKMAREAHAEVEVKVSKPDQPNG